MIQATLPDHLEAIGLQDMMEGETGYTVPWAMFADKNSYLWLNGNYSFDKEPGGTSNMKVTKENGMFIVDVRQCHQKTWNARTPSFVGEFTPLPVSKLIE